MNIQDAKTLSIGQSVSCPADRGDEAYRGIVTHVSEDVNKSFNGQNYVWVTVRANGRSAVWPSNRLGK